MRTKRPLPHFIFIGHEASVSGAPVALLNLLLLLQRKGLIRITLVMSRGGPFLSHYLQHFPVTVLKPAGYGKEKSILKRLAHIGRNRILLFKLLFAIRSCDAIFSNTVVNGKLLKKLSLFKKPVISYIHELENVISLTMKSGDAVQTIYHSSLFAYPSQKVKEVLNAGFHIPASKLHRLSYYFPFNKALINDEVRHAFVQGFKEKYNLTGCSMLVGGMGLASDRKGIDLFIEVCSQVVKADPAIKFCWIGGFENEQVEAACKERIQEKGVGENIVFTGVLTHDYNNLAPFDLFFLSSREDPYPLVVLEAALVKVPAMCFEPSGGITEFVGSDAGWIIPGFGVAEAAHTIRMLNGQQSLLQEKGAHAFRKCLDLHCNEESILNQFTAIVNSL